MHTVLYVLTRALLWCGGDTGTYSADWKCKLTIWNECLWPVCVFIPEFTGGSEEKSHFQAYLRTIKLITIRLCTFGIPDGSQCVLGFAYYVITTYCCIYVYTGGEVCAVSWDFCFLIGVLVMSVVVL